MTEDDFRCVMVPGDPITLFSENWILDPATGETGTIHSIKSGQLDAPNNRNYQPIMMFIDENVKAGLRYERWKAWCRIMAVVERNLLENKP